MRRRNEAGQVTAFVVVFMVAIIAFAGLVIDGSVALSASRRAMNEAQAAARAGAEALNTTIYRDQGISVIDRGAAQTAVDQYMAIAHKGVTPNVTFVGNDTVVVDLSFDQRLNMFGIMTANGHGSARTAHGIVQEGS
jgi:Flp pilus assembly protein TadG